MEFDKIKQLIEKQEIQAISLDTSIFKAEGLKLESGLLKQLGQFSDTSIKIIISEVVKNELLNHLEEIPRSLYTDIDRLLKDAQTYCQFEGDIDLIKASLFQGRKPEEIAYDRLENFIETTSVEIIQVQDNVEVSELLNKYFKNKSPFAGTGKKKNEFPDAMALMSLESWAKKNMIKVLVISIDNDWKQYCTHSKNLVFLESLSKCFELFQEVKPYNICRQLSEKYYQGELDFIKKAITHTLENQMYDFNIHIEANSSYQYEDEITNVIHEGNEFKIIKKPNIIFRPIKFDNDTLVVQAELTVNICIECNFYFTVWDSIDGEDVGIGANTIEKQEDLDVTVLITLIDESGKFYEDIEVDEVEIITTKISIDFDYIEPDWRDQNDDD
ncbi:PIN domain-containing protein [Nostoc sp.]|uniref:PIN domain-containing protein n=1 Tax=Nostoc sp. TaxID=1180 RepID=UPI002FF86188